jgi:hypothetical protein
MLAGKIGIPELLIVLVIALLIFGPSKISSLGKKGILGVSCWDIRLPRNAMHFMSGAEAR